jgi:hypothetical protein
MPGNVTWHQPFLGQVDNLLPNVVGQGAAVDEHATKLVDAGVP